MTVIEELGHFADVPIEVLVELDRNVMRVGDLLALEAGQVLKMKRSAGENLNIVAGGALFAFGEIVIIESSMGVRITDFNLEE